MAQRKTHKILNRHVFSYSPSPQPPPTVAAANNDVEAAVMKDLPGPIPHPSSAVLALDKTVYVEGVEVCWAGSGFFAPHVGLARSKYLVSFQLLDSHHESYAGTRRWPFRELWPGAGGLKAPATGDCLLSGSIVHAALGGPRGEKRSDHQRLPSVGAFTNDQRPGRELGPANVLRRKHLHPHGCTRVHCPQSTCQSPQSVRRTCGWCNGLQAIFHRREREVSQHAISSIQYFGLEVKCRPLHTSMGRYQLDQCIIRRSNCMIHPKSGIARLHSCLAIDGKLKPCGRAAPRYSCVPVPWCFFSPARMHRVGGRKGTYITVARALRRVWLPSSRHIRSRFMHGICKELSLLAKAQLVGCTSRLQFGATNHLGASRLCCSDLAR